MSEETLEITCPSCDAELEIDIGFAGGVCRCSECGTLMTVPADPSQEGPESLQRPEAPGRPERPDVPGQPAAPSEGQLESAAPTPESPPESTPESTPQTAAEPKPGDTFVTASGKTITITAKTPIVTARRRKQAMKVGVIVAFVMVIGGVLAIVIMAVMMATQAEQEAVKGPSQEQITEKIIEKTGFDPNANPMLLDKPNVMGLSLADTTVVIMDASRSSARWFYAVGKVVELGMKQTVLTDHQLQLLAVSEGELAAYPDSPTTWTGAQQDGVAGFVDNVITQGVADLSMAVTRAANAGANQIVLITGRAPQDGSLAAITRDVTAEGKTIKLDVILIDVDEAPTDLKAVADQTAGQVLTVPRNRLQMWKNEWYDAGNE